MLVQVSGDRDWTQLRRFYLKTEVESGLRELEAGGTHFAEDQDSHK
jgi:hypothetical protein